jgi:hypothetical protein
MSAASLARRLLIQAHRWVGIVVGLAAVTWFASGIAMLYVGGMPELTAAARLDRLPAMDFSQVKLTPAQAAARLGDEASRSPPRLVMVQHRPAYRFAGGTVFADDGSLQTPLDEAAAAEVARQFLGPEASPVHLARRLDSPDQWTLSVRQSPLLKYEVDDALGTVLYVSPETAEVVQVTTRGQRTGAWIGTIPHWLYFSALRQNQALWYRIVVGLASLVCVLAVLGLVLAITQWRRTRPLDLQRAIPYRGGMRWHYISGAVFGIFILTWGFSGLLSMEPFEWNNVPELRVDGEAMSGGAVDLARFDSVDMRALPGLAPAGSIREVGFARIHGDHYLSMRTVVPDSDLLVEAATLAPRVQPFDSETILARLRAALPDVPVVGQELLRDYDDYYYSRNLAAPLPVLRVKLDDPLRTWLYINPRNSEVVANLHRHSRIERWLYHGLHSLDFRFWHSKRPLWDLAMITLLLGGLAASSLGLYYGVARVVR